MKAIRVQQFGGPEKLVLEEVPDLEPHAGEILIEIQAAGVNPVETYIRSGVYARLPQLPYTPGSDGAGIVIAVGPAVHRFKFGDRVYTAGSLTGTYAQKALCRESQVYALPMNVSPQQGAALGVPYATAFRALFQKGHAKPGESVLIHGASGGVGIGAVQLARSRGMNVIGTAGNDAGRAIVRESGAHHVLDHNSDNVVQEVLQLTEGRGVSLILEMMANKNLSRDLNMLSRNGRIVVIGNRGTIEINPRDAMSLDASIIGMLLFNASEGDLLEVHAALSAALKDGVVQPVIGMQIPLSESARAHEAVMQPGHYGKIVLLP